MAKEKKISAAKQRIIDNHKQQSLRLKEEGYTEKAETVSVIKANIMVVVTALPIVIVGVLLWVLVRKESALLPSGQGFLILLAAFVATIFIHEALHGVGWSFGAEGGWKSMYIGVMWDSLTPYCHCREPLTPGKYIFGCLFPVLILGAGLYVVAFVTGNATVLWLALLNILAAGGDILIALMAAKYVGKKTYVLDHPTDCGFMAYLS